MKTCCHCKIERPLTEFHKNKSNKDGLQFKCKVCRKEAAAIWHRSHKEVASARAAAYARRNVEKVSERQKIWRQKNLEKCLQVNRAYKEKNKAKVAAYSLAWRAANPKRRNDADRRRKRAKAIVIESSPSLLEERRAKAREVYKVNRASLSDRYVKTVITQTSGIAASSITEELIEAKRLHLQIIRKLKELKA